MNTLLTLKQLITRQWPARRPELPFVWNREWERFFADSDALRRIRVVLCADNPGVEEQRNSVYLAASGRSGQAARKALGQAGYDWATEVLVINKSPIHTPKTADLRGLVDREFLAETERTMARALADLVRATGAFAWIVGMAGCDSTIAGWPRPLRSGQYPASAVLPHYFAELRDGARDLADRVYISKHFSHGHFAVEIREPLAAAAGDLRGALTLLPHARNLFV